MKPNDKHARELKRLAKKKAAAKAAAGDPWANVPCDDAQLTCVATGVLEEDYEQGILVLRALPGGRFAVASFLIDRGVVGLKEAWGYAQSSLAEFNEMLANAREDGLPLATISPAAARALVAGAARYADEYGFRLPKDWQRWAGVLGGVGDWRRADTGPFRPEYAETIAYARRLVGSAPVAFFARPDITFVFPEGEPEPPTDPDAAPAGLTGETVVPAATIGWIEPTPDEYAAMFRLLDKRRASIAADCAAALAELGLTAGPNVAADAVAARAASACIARFGRPPTTLVAAVPLPAGLDAAMADAAYFFARLLDVLFGRSATATESANVLLADGHAIATLERRAR